MDEFYNALESKLTNPEKKARQLALIQRIFDEQDIEAVNLPQMTNEDLKDYGIAQGGLRKSILAVLGKQ